MLKMLYSTRKTFCFVFFVCKSENMSPRALKPRSLEMLNSIWNKSARCVRTIKSYNIFPGNIVVVAGSFTVPTVCHEPFFFPH